MNVHIGIIIFAILLLIIGTILLVLEYTVPGAALTSVGAIALFTGIGVYFYNRAHTVEHAKYY